jgi:hypothetical protein
MAWCSVKAQGQLYFYYDFVLSFVCLYYFVEEIVASNHLDLTDSESESPVVTPSTTTDIPIALTCPDVVNASGGGGSRKNFSVLISAGKAFRLPKEGA